MTERFELPAELTIYTAPQTREDLLAWAKAQGSQGGAPLKIAAGRVGSIDGAGMQLLAALSNMEFSWQLTDCSPAFGDACRLMGLHGWLDSPYLSATQAEVTA